MKNLILLFCLLPLLLLARPNESIEPEPEYFMESEKDFKRYAPLAQFIQLFSGIPASVQLAQAFCETSFGRADTLGTLYYNVFAIKDFPGDYWEGGNGPMMDCYGIKSADWRRYVHPLISWLDHAYFLKTMNPNHCLKPWEYWCRNPVRYGSPGYWDKIAKTIKHYRLYKYDIKTVL